MKGMCPRRALAVCGVADKGLVVIRDSARLEKEPVHDPET
jgi:hypothetical protein